MYQSTSSINQPHLSINLIYQSTSSINQPHLSINLIHQPTSSINQSHLSTNFIYQLTSSINQPHLFNQPRPSINIVHYQPRLETRTNHILQPTISISINQPNLLTNHIYQPTISINQPYLSTNHIYQATKFIKQQNTSINFIRQSTSSAKKLWLLMNPPLPLTRWSSRSVQERMMRTWKERLPSSRIWFVKVLLDPYTAISPARTTDHLALDKLSRCNNRSPYTRYTIYQRCGMRMRFRILPFTMMRIRILPFNLIRIRILPLTFPTLGPSMPKNELFHLSDLVRIRI